MTESFESHRPVLAYGDQANRSPWIAQFAEDGPPRPLPRDIATDLVVVGAGIAGIATVFFVLRETACSVVLLERDRVGRGASGRNAGQLTTYFERPLCTIAEEFGAGRAAEAQRGFEDAHDLLDLIVDESGATVRVERFTGHMGMFNAHQLETHLRRMSIREQQGLVQQTCVVSEEAEFLSAISEEFSPLYSVVSQAQVLDQLEIDDDRYRAVLSARAGCANSGQFCQQTLAYLEHRFSERFTYADCTNVEHVDRDRRWRRPRDRHRPASNRAPVVLYQRVYRPPVQDGQARELRLADDQRDDGSSGTHGSILGRTAALPRSLQLHPQHHYR